MALLPPVADCDNVFLQPVCPLSQKLRASHALRFLRSHALLPPKLSAHDSILFGPSASWNYCAQCCIRVVRLQEDECYLQNHRKNDTDVFSYINVFSRF